MNLQMFLKISSFSEILWALIARVWLLPLMNSQVGLQTSKLSKGFSALITLVINAEWILGCSFKLPFCNKSIGHWLQLYSISPEWILKCFLIDCKGKASPLNEFSSGPPNFQVVKKLFGIDCTGNVFPLNEFSDVPSNYYFVKNVLDIDCNCMVSFLNESSKGS